MRLRHLPPFFHHWQLIDYSCVHLNLPVLATILKEVERDVVFLLLLRAASIDAVATLNDAGICAVASIFVVLMCSHRSL